MYSDLYFRQKKSFGPMLIAALAVVGVASFMTYFFVTSSAPTKAAQLALVRNEIVNPSPNQAGIFWETDTSTTGWVLYGTDKNKLNKTASDERDTSSKSKYKLHYVLLKDLEPNKKYYYRIASATGVVGDREDAAFVFQTPDSLGAAGSSQPAYGKVSLPRGTAADNSIVLLEIPNAYSLLAITKMTGEWLIPMQFVINRDTGGVITLKDTDTVHLSVLSDDMQESKITAFVGKISPLPQTIVLGTSYTFTDTENVLPAHTSNAGQSSNAAIDILFPKQKSIVPATKPLIKGSALPGAAVDLELNSRPRFRFSTEANDKGEWIVNVPKALAPGDYTLVLSSKDASSKQVVVTRTFTIAKSGEQVLGEATGAASPTIEPTVQPTIALPTAEPSSAITATPEATQIPAAVSATITPGPITGYTGPSPANGGPTTGGNGFMYTLVSLGLLVVGAGVFFFL